MISLGSLDHLGGLASSHAPSWEHSPLTWVRMEVVGADELILPSSPLYFVMRDAREFLYWTRFQGPTGRFLLDLVLFFPCPC